jgi:multisubunit Na+/H+ antiporter MnhB subunit
MAGERPPGTIPEANPAAAPERAPEATLEGASDGVRRYVVPALIAALLSFALGLAHLLPGVAFWDPGEFQTIAPVLGTAHPTGYPAYVLLGWLASIVLAPVGDPALRMNLLSAIVMAAASGVATLLLVRLTDRPILAFAGGIAFAATPITWYLGTHADPHALHGLLLAMLLLLLVVWGDRRRTGLPRTDRWLVAASVTYGISLGNHQLTLLLAPGIALYVLATDPRIVLRPALVVGCAVAVLGTAALLYLQLPLSVALGAPLVYGRPETWDGFWYVVLGEQFRGVVTDPLADPAGTLRTLAGAVWDQLGWLALAVPIAGVATAVHRPRYALLTGTAFVATLVFAAAYRNAEIERYYLGPALIAISWVVVAVGWVADLVADRPATPLDGPRGERARLVSALVAGVLAIGLVAPSLIDLPAREEVVRGVDYLDARAWLDETLADLEPDAVVLSWWSYSTPLWYGTIVEGRRPDIRIVDDRTLLDEGLGSVSDVIRAELGRRPVYVVRDATDIPQLEEEFVLETVHSVAGQPVFRVVSARGSGT